MNAIDTTNVRFKDVTVTDTNAAIVNVNANANGNANATDGIIELPPNVRLPLETYSGTGTHAVFMYSTTADGNVTLQLRDPEDLDKPEIAAMLSKLQQDDSAMLSISYLQESNDMLSDNSIDVLLSSNCNNLRGENDDSTTRIPTTSASTFNLFDSASSHDLTLSPQSFTNSTECFLKNNSDKFGASPNSDSGGNKIGDNVKKKHKSTANNSTTITLTTSTTSVSKRCRQKSTASPNRQGPQQCQICSKVFGNVSALAKHKLTHSDERKYICSICGKAFKRQDHLNGHLLTHRHKKPYECKAEGCSKSYCDARSLRRHTENHHNQAATGGTAVAAAISSASPNSNATMSPAQGAASGDAASPHGSSCIQYAPPPTTSSNTISSNTNSSTVGKSHLQKLLSSEPLKSSNNDGLTKQQLDLIQQIMEQTSRQSPVNKNGMKISNKLNGKGALRQQQSKNHKSAQSLNLTVNTKTTSILIPVTTAVTSVTSRTKSISTATATLSRLDSDPKPVECNLCHRKFKNIPALNGHMRLHGGYFKKFQDSDGKKMEKKESHGPPLQTASSSVRALIEEKIISKRITMLNGNLIENGANAKSATAATATAALSFAIPALPNVDKSQIGQSSTQTQQIQLQFRSSDNITNNHNETLTKSFISYQQQQQQQQDQQSSISKSSTSNYFNSADVLINLPNTLSFHETADTLVDPDIVSLDQFAKTSESSFSSTHSINPDLETVLNSPLPDNLAEFSNTYHTSFTTNTTQSSPATNVNNVQFLYHPPNSNSTCTSSGGGGDQDPDDFTARASSSPFSAAFFTPTMSSSAAVEEALEQVLPGESLSPDDMYASLTDSPTAIQSPLSVVTTPIQSPLSNSSIPSTSTSSQSSLSSGPIKRNIVHNNNNNNYISHMMINSDDPLLSSNPKEQLRKKLEFSNNTIVRIPTNHGGFIDITNSALAGILVDSNGEWKLIQTANLFQNKNVLLPTNTNKMEVEQQSINNQTDFGLKNDSFHSSSFLIPNVITSNPNQNSEKRQTHELNSSQSIQRHSSIIYNSYLRNVRSKSETNTNDEQFHYTPPPILDPTRISTGLFHSINDDSVYSASCDIINDSTPHINLGSRYQCELSDFVVKSELIQEDYFDYYNNNKCSRSSSITQDNDDKAIDTLLWDPAINELFSNSEMDNYLEFACSLAIPGGGQNKEFALHLLHNCSGDMNDAILKLMQPVQNLSINHSLVDYTYLDSDPWSRREIELFTSAFLNHGKNFQNIANHVQSKSIAQCVQFYYLWKKACHDDYKQIRLMLSTKRSHHLQVNHDDKFFDIKMNAVTDMDSDFSLNTVGGITFRCLHAIIPQIVDNIKNTLCETNIALVGLPTGMIAL